MSVSRRITIAFLLVSAACKDGTAPPAAASINATEANAPTATAGIVLVAAPSFVVKDASGNILGGVPVTITVTSGGGTLTNAPTQTVAGAPTPIGTFIPGKVAGPNTITITVGNLAPIVITIIGTAGAPASIAVLSGDNQLALAGTIPPADIRVQVRDQFGNGVPNTPVIFTVGNGSGTVSSAPVNTDGTGVATSPPWQLGRSAVPQILQATAGSLTVVVTAAVLSSYHPEIRFFGPTPAAAAMTAFTSAAARIRASIVGDIPDFNNFIATPQDVSACGPTGVVLNEPIDDVIIYATVVPIDGPGRILASAGSCLSRPGSLHTIIGTMRFDADDINGLATSGRLDDTVLHEMLHVVGINRFKWEPKGLIAGAGTPETRYTGVLGVAACVTLGGAAVCPGSVPLENTGGPGTADSHWRETVFDSELMTGFIEGLVGGVRIPNQYSLMTIQALADLGYTVNPAAADPYTVPTPVAAPLRQSASSDATQAWEVLLPPRLEVTPTGGIRTLRVQ
ncbi:MAG: leishmanolysin-related zinc metalloendopeptidase [Gemmatimonadaceae bacterium]